MAREELIARMRTSATHIRTTLDALPYGAWSREEDASIALLLDEAANALQLVDAEITAVLTRNMRLVDELDDYARQVRALKARNRLIADKMLRENA